MNRREAITALLALPATTKITRANVGPGDVIVLEMPGPVEPNEADLLAAQLQKIWPDNRCVVLERGSKLSIVAAGTLR